MRIFGIQTLPRGVKKMNAPGVGVTMFDRGKSIVVGQPSVDTDEYGLRPLEDFVMQADTNWRQVHAAVDDAGLPRCLWVDVVDGSLADRHAQHVAHQFHAAVRTVEDQSQAQRQLAQSRLGNRQLEQHLVIRRAGCEDLVQGGARLGRLLVHELATHVVLVGQAGDRCRSRQRKYG